MEIVRDLFLTSCAILLMRKKSFQKTKKRVETENRTVMVLTMETIQFSNIEFNGGNLWFTAFTKYQPRSEEGPGMEVVAFIEDLQTTGNINPVEVYNDLTAFEGQSVEALKEFLKENES